MFEKDDVVQKTLDQAAGVAPGRTHGGDELSYPKLSSSQVARKKQGGSYHHSPKAQASTATAKKTNKIAVAACLEMTQKIAW